MVGLEMQIPYENPKHFSAFLQYALDFKPDRVVIIGDFLDVPGPSRWNRGTALEFSHDLQKECTKGNDYLRQLRNTVGDQCVIDFHNGNHEKRVQSYIRNKAPAFDGLDALRIPNLLGFDLLGINLLADVAPFASGWITTHGDSISKSVSAISGGTAIRQGKRLGKSVICGHTHRLGMINETLMGKSLTGIETGHMMDLNKASYVSYPNWQAGFAAFELEKDRVTNIRLVRLNANGGISW